MVYASDPKQVPILSAVQDSGSHRLGSRIYPFRMKRLMTNNRPADEVQLSSGTDQRRAGSPRTTSSRAIQLSVDVTLLLAVFPEGNMIVGLDPWLIDPLPLGISVYAKDKQVREVAQGGWSVWERTNRAGNAGARRVRRKALKRSWRSIPSRLL